MCVVTILLQWDLKWYANEDGLEGFHWLAEKPLPYGLTHSSSSPLSIPPSPFPPFPECSSFSPPATVILLILLCFEGLLFLIFTAVMFGTQVHSICTDETVSCTLSPAVFTADITSSRPLVFVLWLAWSSWTLVSLFLQGFMRNAPQFLDFWFLLMMILISCRLHSYRAIFIGQGLSLDLDYLSLSVEKLRLEGCGLNTLLNKMF